MSILLAQNWDVKNEQEDDYLSFIAEKYNPTVKSLGLQIVGGYYVEVGAGPSTVAVLSADDVSLVNDIVVSEEYRKITNELNFFVNNRRAALGISTGRISKAAYTIQEGVWKWNHYYNVRSRIFMVPPAKGIDHRIVNGRVYITPIGIADPKEIEARIPLFMKRAGYYYQNWDKIHGDWVEKTKELIAELEAVEFKNLPEMEDESVVFEHRGMGSGYDLCVQYDHLINMGFKVWQYHFELLNLGYAAYVTFINTANQFFPDIPMATLTKMVSGIDVVMYRPDAELIKLAKMALELKLESKLNAQSSFATLQQELEGSDAGKKWLAAFEEARYPWFWISTGTGWFHHDKSWNDDLDVPLASIKMHIESLQAGKDPSRPTEKLIAERDRIVAEYLDLFQNPDDKKAFEEALGIARKVFPYVENHLFYVEHWFHSVFWNKMRDLSRVLVDGGMIKEVEDIWYLNRSDIKVLIDDMVRAWATGIVPAGRNKWPREIEWRKGVMEKFREWTPPPALGVAPEVVTEPFSIVLWGVTTDVLKKWLTSLETGDGGEITELHGSPGSSGIVQGKARVIKRVEDLSSLQAKISIDASYGLGEAVVSGLVTPDTYLIDKITLDPVKIVRGSKEIECVYCEGGSDIVEQEVDEKRRQVNALSQEELRHLCIVSKKIEKYYGKAYDIEFGIDADLPFPENVIILQVRPESIWNKKKAEKKTAEPTDAMNMILKQLINGVKFN